METTTYHTYEAVLDVVRTWPPEKRFLLIQDVIKTLEPTFRAGGARQPTAEKALGLLATEQPAPSDTEVQQWLEEHRMEEYGCGSFSSTP